MTSPLHALQVRSHDVAELARFFVGDVVAEMRAIPDDHVSAIQGLAIHPGVEACLVRWPGGDHTIVDL